MLDAIIPLISLISLEVILGIDNVIFISILSDKLPDSQRNKLRYWGLGLAMVRNLIQNFGGTISFENQDKGASFTITIPTQ